MMVQVMDVEMVGRDRDVVERPGKCRSRELHVRWVSCVTVAVAVAGHRHCLWAHCARNS
jgi:hypothetical protein